MNPRYAQLALQARHRCEYCHAPEAAFNLPFEVEHVIPIARGRADDETNCALSCRACDLRKSAHISAIDPQSQRAVRLFHPRQDRWEEHFRVNPENGEIEGLTAIGRGTVAQLRMNSDAQMAARRQWIRLGLFP
ncbi:MAG: HNH endonuclease [Planctomycetes bacterium]|nr:HNH endonuclease [Planctomycetota bacterium]